MVSAFGVLFASDWKGFCSLPLGVLDRAWNMLLVDPCPKAGADASENAMELGGEKGEVADEDPGIPCVI